MSAANPKSLMHKVPFHMPYITDDEITEVVDSLRSGWLTMGPKTIDFENRFAGYIGSSHAVSMNSCTACLHLALKAIGIKKGDEVIVPVMTFSSTAGVLHYFGAKPVFVDVDPGTLNLDASKIERSLTRRTRAIIPVHYAGQPCDMDDIADIAKNNSLYVIEDAAHALPALYKGRKVGTIGDITCFSFYATKTLSTGEGGMVTTENGEWAERLRILRLHGISKDAWKRYAGEGSWYYEVLEPGYKYNMTDIQAALGLAQLRKLEWMWMRRKEISLAYLRAFSAMEELSPLEAVPDRESAHHLYPIFLRPETMRIDRNRFIEEMKARGIGTSVHFIPLYRHPFYRKTGGYKPEDFPSAEWAYERMVSLPIYPGMSDEDVAAVFEAVDDIIRKFRR
jgi:perosamine synthetase